MEIRVNYTLVGSFVIALAFAGLFATIWLSDNANTHNYDTYLVYSEESVAGLRTNAPVTLNGVEVGFVDKVSIMPDNPKAVNIQVNILKDIPINTSTYAHIETQAITGLSTISLFAEQSNAPPLMAEAGQNFPTIYVRATLFAHIEKSINDLTNNIEQVSTQLKNLLNENNTNTIKHILQNLEQATSALAYQTLPNVNQVSQRLDTITLNIQELTDNLRRDPSVIIHGFESTPGPGE